MWASLGVEHCVALPAIMQEQGKPHCCRQHCYSAAVTRQHAARCYKMLHTCMRYACQSALVSCALNPETPAGLPRVLAPHRRRGEAAAGAGRARVHGQGAAMFLVVSFASLLLIPLCSA